MGEKPKHKGKWILADILDGGHGTWKPAENKDHVAQEYIDLKKPDIAAELTRKLTGWAERSVNGDSGRSGRSGQVYPSPEADQGLS